MRVTALSISFIKKGLCRLFKSGERNEKAVPVSTRPLFMSSCAVVGRILSSFSRTPFIFSSTGFIFHRFFILPLSMPLASIFPLPEKQQRACDEYGGIGSHDNPQKKRQGKIPYHRPPQYQKRNKRKKRCA